MVSLHFPLRSVGLRQLLSYNAWLSDQSIMLTKGVRSYHQDSQVLHICWDTQYSRLINNFFKFQQLT